MSWRDSESTVGPRAENLKGLGACVEPDLIDSLEELMTRGKSPANREFLVSRLMSATRPRSHEVLARTLSWLETKGFITQFIRVESKSGAGIKEFASLLNVPDTIYDPFEEEERAVELDDCQVLYRLR